MKRSLKHEVVSPRAGRKHEVENQQTHPVPRVEDLVTDLEQEEGIPPIVHDQEAVKERIAQEHGEAILRKDRAHVVEDPTRGLSSREDPKEIASKAKVTSAATKKMGATISSDQEEMPTSSSVKEIERNPTISSPRTSTSIALKRRRRTMAWSA